MPESPVHVVLERHPLLDVGWRAALAAADFLANERPDDLAVETKSTPTDAVTAMDRGAEARIVEVISSTRPDDGVLGEEGGERHGTSGVRWIVDPLDGTVNYLYRLPAWAVSIAAEVDGVVEVGVIVAPALGEAYVAVRGQGAWAVEGGVARPIRVSACTDLACALVATGFGYAAATRQAQGAVVQRLLGRIRDIRRGGGAAVDFCWLARGRLDGYYEEGLNPWDIAAGALVAAEAGAVVRGLAGADPNEGVMVAVTPAIAEDFMAALSAAGA